MNGIHLYQRVLLAVFLVIGSRAMPQSAVQQTRNDAVRMLESSANPHLRQHANVLIQSIWLTPKIYVCWENPSQEFNREMDLVHQEVADTWARESRLVFTGWQKCATENKGVRIRIADEGPHTLGLGRAIDGVPNGMALDFTFAKWSPACQMSRDYCIRAIAGHEFGHAIGFAHEQNRPDTPGECRALAQGPNGTDMLTPYDPHSIMNYCNSNYNNDGKLSLLDINAVQTLYGAIASRLGSATDSVLANLPKTEDTANHRVSNPSNAGKHSVHIGMAEFRRPSTH